VNGLKLYYEIHGTTHITVGQRANLLARMIVLYLDGSLPAATEQV
jgi:hypothetical protein